METDNTKEEVVAGMEAMTCTKEVDSAEVKTPR